MTPNQETSWMLSLLTNILLFSLMGLGFCIYSFIQKFMRKFIKYLLQAS